MLKREQKLRQSPSSQRAISLPLSSRHEINRQLRLRVVREFNLPDAVADLLEVSTPFFLKKLNYSKECIRYTIYLPILVSHKYHKIVVFLPFVIWNESIQKRLRIFMDFL